MISFLKKQNNFHEQGEANKISAFIWHYPAVNLVAL